MICNQGVVVWVASKQWHLEDVPTLPILEVYPTAPFLHFVEHLEQNYIDMYLYRSLCLITSWLSQHSSQPRALLIVLNTTGRRCQRHLRPPRLNKSTTFVFSRKNGQHCQLRFTLGSPEDIQDVLETGCAAGSRHTIFLLDISSSPRKYSPTEEFAKDSIANSRAYKAGPR